MYKRPVQVLLLYRSDSLGQAICRQISAFQQEPSLLLRAIPIAQEDAQASCHWADLLICVNFDFHTLGWDKPAHAQLKRWNLEANAQLDASLKNKINNIINGIRLMER